MATEPIGNGWGGNCSAVRVVAPQITGSGAGLALRNALRNQVQAMDAGPTVCRSRQNGILPLVRLSPYGHERGETDLAGQLETY